MNPLLRTVLPLGVLCLAALAALAACGGDDDPATAGSAGRYAGTWASGCTDLSAALGRPNSYKTVLSITSPNATTYTSTGGNTEWPNASCAGTGTAIVGESGSTTFTVVGTKAIGADTVDKLTYATGATTTAKSISSVSADGRSLRLSGGGALDAEGYPSVLNTTVYTKQ